MRRVALLLLVLTAAGLLAGCEITNTLTGGNGGQGGQGGTGGGLTPTPTPGSGSSGGSATGPRTPDPAPGTVLPLPTYGPQALAEVTNAAALVVSSCTSSAYLDALLVRLRVRDTRWGRVCATPSCSTLRMDTVGYHATAGADVTGVTGSQTVDVIQNVCSAAVAQWLPLGYEPATALAF